MQQEYQNNLENISRDELRQFLRFCTLRNMDIDASQLSNEEQSKLFDLLDRLHKSQSIDVKGLWGIISLNFQNRSGLFLMTMFHNSNIQVAQIFHKKIFMKDIQVLENPHLSVSNLVKLLQILGIQIFQFVQRFKQWKAWKQATILQQTNNRTRRLVLLSDLKLYDENEYDSEPEILLYKIKEQYSDVSYVSDPQIQISNSLSREESQQVANQQQQQTISLKRKVYEGFQRPRERRQKNKKTKRPNPRKKQQKLKQQLKVKQRELIHLASQRKEIQKLKRNYEFLKSISRQQINIQTPKKQAINVHMNETRRKRRQVKKPNYNNYEEKTEQNQMDIQDSGQISSRFINDSFDNEDIECNHSQMIEQQNQKQRKKIKKIIKKRAKQNNEQEYQQQSVEQMQCLPQLQNEQAINQKIENILIRKINFPTNRDDLIKQNLLSQEDRRQFNSHEWCDYLSAMSQKQKWKLVKEVTMLKNEISYESMVNLFKMTKAHQLSQLVPSYIKPLLSHKLTKTFGLIISEMANVLYTSSLEKDVFMGVHQACKNLVLLHHEVQSGQANQVQKLNSYFFECLANLIHDINTKQQKTLSLIDLPRPSDVVKSIIRIKLEDEDLIQTLLICITILVHGFFKKMFQLKNNSPALVVINKQIFMCYKSKIKQKARFAQHIYEIYEKFQIPISTNEEFQFIISYIQDIDLNESQPYYFYEIMPSLTRSFLSQKLNQNIQAFNYKPVLNYLSLNEFMKKCKSTHNQLASQIVLRTYQVLMEYDKFHNQFTINQIINYVKTIDLKQRHQQSFICIVLCLLIKCYQVKINQNELNVATQIKNLDMNNNKNKGETLNILQARLLNFIQQFCEKIIITLRHTSDKAQEKSQKFQRIIQKYLQQFVNDSKMSLHIGHFLFTLKITIMVIYPLFNKLNKQTAFSAIISENLMQKFNQILTIKNEIEKINQKVFNAENDMDEQQRVQIVFNRIQQNQKLFKVLINQIKAIINQSNLTSQIPKQFIILGNLKEAIRENVYYEIQGIVTVLSLLQQPIQDAKGNHENKPNENKSSIYTLKSNIFKHLNMYTTKVQLIKFHNFHKTSLKIVLCYIKGLLKTIVSLAFCKQMNSKLNQLGNIIRDPIYDIFFIGLTCEQDTKDVTQLLSQSYKIPHFSSSVHLLAKVRLNEIKYKQSIDLNQVYLMIESKRKILTNQIWNSFINKFKSHFLQIWIKLYQFYGEINWLQQRSHLAFNIINTFTFLIKIDANQDVQKIFRSYFVMKSSEVYQNISHCQINVLRGLEIRQDTAQGVVQLFKTAFMKKKQGLDQTRQCYLDYLVNLALTKKERIQNSFNRLKLIIQVLNNKCQYSPKLNQTYNFYQNRADHFSLMMCKNLLSNLLSKSFLMNNDQIKQTSINFFFSLFKTYPKLGQAYMDILKCQYDKIDKVLRSQQKNNYINLPESLEEAIKKYLLKQDCQFQKLLSILWHRSRNSERLKKNKKHLVQLKQIIQRCLKYLSAKNSNEQFENLKRQYHSLIQYLIQYEKNQRSRLNLQQIFGVSQCVVSKMDESSGEQNKKCN